MNEKRLNLLAIGIMLTAFGIGLVVLPWLLEFHNNDDPALAFWATGGVVAVLGILTAVTSMAIIGLVTLIAGAWAIAAPFVMDFAEMDPIVAVYLLIGAGVVIAIMSIAVLLPVRDRAMVAA